MSITLQTNIPLTGTIKFVDHAKSTKETDGVPWADQIAINGDWDDGQKGKVYLPLTIGDDLANLGVIGNRTGDSYRVIRRGAKIKLLRKEDGKRKFTTIELIGGREGNANPDSPQQAPAAAASAAAISRPPSQPVGQQPRISFGTIKRSMSAMVKTAKELLTENQESGGVGEISVALFNAAYREGLIVDPPKKASQAQLDKVAELCVKLNHSDVGLAGIVAGRFKIKGVEDLTEVMANMFIRDLQLDLDKQEQEAKNGDQTTLYRGEEEIPFALLALIMPAMALLGALLA